jgi:TolB-like protein
MDRKWFFWLLLAVIMSGITFTAETAFCTRVAVIDFESIGDDPNIGRGVTEIVRTELIKTGNYEVVERALLNKIIEEQRFQLSDLVDPSKAVELGKLLGADLILTGSVVKIGTSYTINARFIDVKTGMAKRAEAIRGNEINELTYMSGQLIGILEQEVKPAPVVPPEKRPSVVPPEEPQERFSVPVPTRMEIKAGPKSYITFSVGYASFSMKHLKNAIERLNYAYEGYVDTIDSGLNLDFGAVMMVTKNIGVGLSSSLLMGVTSGEFSEPLVYVSGTTVRLKEIEVIGVTFALRPLFRQALGDHIALCLGGDVGGISVSYSDLTKGSSYKTKGSGVGPLFGVFASCQLSTGHFLLQGDIGFRSAKGEVELEYDVTQELEFKELDFSGPYLLMTAGIRL